MPLIPFPNVPKLPGVPALRRAAGVAIQVAAGATLLRRASASSFLRIGLGLLQGALWRSVQVDNRWGIFTSSGRPLADPGKFKGIAAGFLNAAGIGPTLSTGGMDYSKETRVSDFPIERGSFASYNKVEQPATPNVTLCLTGSESDRRKFLQEIDKACKSTELYHVMTPEVGYMNYSIERYNYQRRSSKGATLLIVEISLKEVRQVSAAYAQANAGKVEQPKDAGAAPAADTGKVQAKKPEVSTLKSLANKLPSLADKAGSLMQGGQ